jgi:hypothetical protein
MPWLRAKNPSQLKPPLACPLTSSAPKVRLALSPSLAPPFSPPSRVHAVPTVSADTWVLDCATNLFVPRNRDDVRPGDVVRVCAGEYGPADCVILRASGEACVDRACYDGDRSLRIRFPALLPWDTLAASAQEAREGGSQLMGLLGLGADALPDADCAAFFARLRAAGHFVAQLPRYSFDRFSVVFESTSGAGPTKLNAKNMLPAMGRVVLTEEVIALVVYAGQDTKFAMNGGWPSMQSRSLVLAAEKQAEKQRKEREKEEKAQKLAEGRDPAELERETGLAWEDRFTDVPDDGNCMVHAIWLGLRRLLELYPHLRSDGEAELPASADEFRAMLFDRICEPGATDYVLVIENQFRLWLSLDAETLMTAVEDFFTLPSDFQERILGVHQMAQFDGGESVDFSSLVHEYVTLMRTRIIINDRTCFAPLGAPELDAIVNVLRIRLQTFKSECVELMRKRAQGGIVDPRRIPPDQINDRTCDGGSARVVRILNVNTNHYQVHLPAAAPSAGATGASAASADSS